MHYFLITYKRRISFLSSSNGREGVCLLIGCNSRLSLAKIMRGSWNNRAQDDFTELRFLIWPQNYALLFNFRGIYNSDTDNFKMSVSVRLVWCKFLLRNYCIKFHYVQPVWSKWSLQWQNKTYSFRKLTSFSFVVNDV